MWWCHFPSLSRQLKLSGSSCIRQNDRILFCRVALSPTAEPLLSYMQIVTEIVVPTVCTLCTLIAAVLLMLLLQSLSWDRVTHFVAASFTENLWDLLQDLPPFSPSKVYIHLFSGSVIITFPLPVCLVFCLFCFVFQIFNSHLQTTHILSYWQSWGLIFKTTQTTH